MRNPLNIGLPKWSGIRVMGRPVSKSQAEEILVRTDSWDIMTNSQELRRSIREIMFPKFPTDSAMENKRLELFEYEEQRKKKFGVLDLEHLTNSQIVTSYIRGPYGWCDWEGRIALQDINIGKYPSSETVFNEWQLIAETFPFLSLTCQLFSGEHCEYDAEPVIEYVVSGGSVTARPPGPPLDVVGGSARWLPDRHVLNEPYDNVWLASHESGIRPDALASIIARLEARSP